MFKENEKIKAIGSFVVKNVGEEYIELDPHGKGHESVLGHEVVELNEFGAVKVFDGFSEGDIFELPAEYTVIRSNELFTKVRCGEYMLSLPNHKLMEVE